MVVKSLAHKKILHKRTKRFVRFESEDYPHKLKPSWRRPRGIDNRVRRRFRGNRPMAKTGYRSDKSTRYQAIIIKRYLDQQGFRKFLIRSPKELEILLTNNRVFAGELAHNLSARKRATLVQRAAELNVRLTNGRSKVRAEEKKE
ncbi:60S ribosomal protein L32 [Paramecium bursaria]